PAAFGAGRVLAVDRLAHYYCACVYTVGFHSLGRDAVVADEWIREHDDLAGVARIADRLLVAGHRGVEDDLADARGSRGAQLAVEAGAILEQDVARAHGATPIAKARSR